MDGLRELALFAGAGGGILGGKLLGWRTVCAVERDPYAASVLMQRQNDGILDPFPVWDDVCTFDGKPWRGRVDVVSGGFPCQDISVAGRGAGIEGKRSGLWGKMERVISDILPRFVFVENSPMLTVRGGVRVIADLAALGYVCRWATLGGYSAGNCADGQRRWIVADASNSLGWFTPQVQSLITDPKKASRRQLERAIREAVSEKDHIENLRDAHGLAVEMDELKAAGNGQMPNLAAIAWRTLTCN